MTANDSVATTDRAPAASTKIGFAAVAASLVLLAGTSAMVTIAPAYAQAVTEKQVLDVLTKNPTIIERAVVSLQQQRQVDQQRELLAAAKPVSERIIAGDRRVPFIGNPKGKAVVEYFDYNCGYCKKFSKDTATPLLAKNRNVRLILVLAPILGPGSERMAEFAAAAHLQGRFAPAHQFLIGQSARTVAEADALKTRLIATAGLDRAAFDKALGNGTAKAVVAHNLGLSQKAGVTGTPMIYAGGTIAPGAISLQQVEAMLAR